MHDMHDLQCLNAGITPGCYSVLHFLPSVASVRRLRLSLRPSVRPSSPASSLAPTAGIRRPVCARLGLGTGPASDPGASGLPACHTMLAMNSAVRFGTGVLLECWDKALRLGSWPCFWPWVGRNWLAFDEIWVFPL